MLVGSEDELEPWGLAMGCDPQGYVGICGRESFHVEHTDACDGGGTPWSGALV